MSELKVVFTGTRVDAHGRSHEDVQTLVNPTSVDDVAEALGKRIMSGSEAPRGMRILVDDEAVCDTYIGSDTIKYLEGWLEESKKELDKA